ncbi:unnamed protein product, partial [Darwinula stevensoni]
MEEGHLSVRIVVVNYHMTTPTLNLDPTYSSFRGSGIHKVPVIRIFGSTPNGQKTCLHIHGIFPYFYVPYDGSISPERVCHILAASLDKALNLAMGQPESSTQQHVYKVVMVSGLPFYGYHRRECQFLKVFFYNPLIIKKAADLLLSGCIMGQSLQPHETHIPFILQFLMDFKLYGMNLIKCKNVKFRRKTFDLKELTGIKDQSSVSFMGNASSFPSLQSSSHSSRGSQCPFYDPGSLPESLLLPESVPRTSTSTLEADVRASDILNPADASRLKGQNPGIVEIWHEERERRGDMGFGKENTLTPPSSPDRKEHPPTDSHLFYESRLLKRLSEPSSAQGMASPKERGLLNVTLAREINSEESGRFPPASLLSLDDIERREEPSSWIYDTQVDEELVLSLSQHTPNVFSQTLNEEDKELVDILMGLSNDGGYEDGDRQDPEAEDDDTFEMTHWIWQQEEGELNEQTDDGGDEEIIDCAEEGGKVMNDRKIVGGKKPGGENIEREQELYEEKVKEEQEENGIIEQGDPRLLVQVLQKVQEADDSSEESSSVDNYDKMGHTEESEDSLILRGHGFDKTLRRKGEELDKVQKAKEIQERGNNILEVDVEDLDEEKIKGEQEKEELFGESIAQAVQQEIVGSPFGKKELKSLEKPQGMSKYDEIGHKEGNEGDLIAKTLLVDKASGREGNEALEDIDREAKETICTEIAYRHSFKGQNDLEDLMEELGSIDSDADLDKSKEMSQEDGSSSGAVDEEYHLTPGQRCQDDHICPALSQQYQNDQDALKVEGQADDKSDPREDDEDSELERKAKTTKDDETGALEADLGGSLMEKEQENQLVHQKLGVKKYVENQMDETVNFEDGANMNKCEKLNQEENSKGLGDAMDEEDTLTPGQQRQDDQDSGQESEEGDMDQSGGRNSYTLTEETGSIIGRSYAEQFIEDVSGDEPEDSVTTIEECHEDEEEAMIDSLIEDGSDDKQGHCDDRSRSNDLSTQEMEDFLQGSFPIPPTDNQSSLPQLDGPIEESNISNPTSHGEFQYSISLMGEPSTTPGCVKNHGKNDTVMDVDFQEDSIHDIAMLEPEVEIGTLDSIFEVPNIPVVTVEDTLPTVAVMATGTFMTKAARKLMPTIQTKAALKVGLNHSGIPKVNRNSSCLWTPQQEEAARCALGLKHCEVQLDPMELPSAQDSNPLRNHPSPSTSSKALTVDKKYVNVTLKTNNPRAIAKKSKVSQGKTKMSKHSKSKDRQSKPSTSSKAADGMDDIHPVEASRSRRAYVPAFGDLDQALEEATFGLIKDLTNHAKGSTHQKAERLTVDAVPVVKLHRLSADEPCLKYVRLSPDDLKVISEHRPQRSSTARSKTRCLSPVIEAYSARANGDHETECENALMYLSFPSPRHNEDGLSLPCPMSLSESPSENRLQQALEVSHKITAITAATAAVTEGTSLISTHSSQQESVNPIVAKKFDFPPESSCRQTRTSFSPDVGSSASHVVTRSSNKRASERQALKRELKANEKRETRQTTKNQYEAKMNLQTFSLPETSSRMTTCLSGDQHVMGTISSSHRAKATKLLEESPSSFSVEECKALDKEFATGKETPSLKVISKLSPLKSDHSQKIRAQTLRKSQSDTHLTLTKQASSSKVVSKKVGNSQIKGTKNFGKSKTETQTLKQTIIKGATPDESTTPSCPMRTRQRTTEAKTEFMGRLSLEHSGSDRRRSLNSPRNETPLKRSRHESLDLRECSVMLEPLSQEELHSYLPPLISLTFDVIPPSFKDVIATLKNYDIPEARNVMPYFSDPSDAPAEAKVVGQTVLRVPTSAISELPSFQGDSKFDGELQCWKAHALAESDLANSSIIQDIQQEVGNAGSLEMLFTTGGDTWLTLAENPPDPVSFLPCAFHFIEEIIHDIMDNVFGTDHQEETVSVSSSIDLFATSTPYVPSESPCHSTMPNPAARRCLDLDAIEEESLPSQDKDPLPLTPGVQTESQVRVKLRPSSSQLEGPTPDHTFMFGVSHQGLQDAAGKREHDHLMLLSVELHTESRGDLLPDPEFDAIAAIFYSWFQDDGVSNSLKPQTGVLVRDIDSLNKEAPMTHCLLWKSGITSIPVEYVADETSLIWALVNLVHILDPDILVGYEASLLATMLKCLQETDFSGNVASIQHSSWGYLMERAAHLNIILPPKLSRIPEDQGSQMDEEIDPYGAEHSSAIRIVGRITLNLWRLMKSEVALMSYTFESMAFHILHERVPKFSHRKLHGWWNGPTQLNLWRVVEYYAYRVSGNLALMEKLDLVGRTSELARLFGILFFDVLSRGSQYRVESMMLRLAKPHSYIPVSPSVTQRANMKAPECLQLIMEPESRFYADPVIVLDFQSLYPSMMIAYNYCFSTCVGRVDLLGTENTFEFGTTCLQIPPEEVHDLMERNNLNISPCGVGFVKASIRKGILPQMLEEILNTRIMVKQSMKLHKDNKALKRILDARQLGLKLIANVTYGYTSANFSGRMPCVEVGDSVVSKGRETLERAIHLVENSSEWSAKVIYGDTDSLFVLLPGRTKETAFQIGLEMAAAITADNPKPVKLKFEKVYMPCILQTKKRYVGYMYESPDQREAVYDAKGIETILEKMLRTLFETRDLSRVKGYVQRQFQKIVSGRVNIQDLTFAKEFRGLGGYKPGACVPALELTRQQMRMDRRAVPRVGERVPYVITYGTPGVPLIQLVKPPLEVVQDPSLRLNAHYYISRVIIPPLDRCLSLLGVSAGLW